MLHRATHAPEQMLRRSIPKHTEASRSMIRRFIDSCPEQITPKNGCPFRDAAKRIGVSEKAIRSRLIRRTLRSKKSNDGHVHVLIQNASSALRDASPRNAPEIHRSISGADHTEALPLRDSVPRELHKEIVDGLKQALANRDRQHRETVAMLVERVDAAEIRAERVEMRMDQVLDALLEQRRPWWRWLTG